MAWHSKLATSRDDYIQLPNIANIGSTKKNEITDNHREFNKKNKQMNDSHNQLRLVVYPVIYRFFCIPGGDRSPDF